MVNNRENLSCVSISIGKAYRDHKVVQDVITNGEQAVLNLEYNALLT